MWFATLPNGITTWIQPGQSYTIGRKINNDLVLSVKSVSKLHATIKASPVQQNESGKVNSRYSLSIVDHNSTGGTYINGGSERIAAGVEVNITHRHGRTGTTSSLPQVMKQRHTFLTFGRIRADNRYDEIQLTWIPIIATYSSGGSFSGTSPEGKHLEWILECTRYLEPLGVKIIPEF